MNRNVSDAFIAALADIWDNGSVVVAREQEQREVLSRLIQIACPNERVMIVPGRNNNVFAQIAETLWVLAGRNDITYLTRYLPRAKAFSDDGKTWRAGYGPRIRCWRGRIDQVSEVINRLTEDPCTKRAVVSIFDPDLDYCQTKDVPCNNWLQFMQRDGRLHLNVTVRANDLIWGFSGINVFEWSVLQEIIAASLDLELGSLSWFVGTLHIYSRHYRVARRIIEACEKRILTPYDFGVGTIPIRVPLASMDEELERFMHVEQASREQNHELADALTSDIADRFFRAAATMLHAYNAYLNGANERVTQDIVSLLPPSDLRVAAVEYFLRQRHFSKAPPYLLDDEFEFLAYVSRFSAAPLDRQ